MTVNQGRNMSKTVKDMFANDNYSLAEIFDSCLREKPQQPKKSHQEQYQKNSTAFDLYYSYGDSLARCGRLYEAFDVYAQIANRLGHNIPLERLKDVAGSLVDALTASTASHPEFNNPESLACPASASNSRRLSQKLEFEGQRKSQLNCSSSSLLDPLLCPVCEEVLRCPVTVSCGHTFCKQCYEQCKSECHLCNVRFSVSPTIANTVQNGNCIGGSSSSALKPDVLIRRLVDKWWAHEIQARNLNDNAVKLLDTNSLDDALKCCNESLEKSPNNYKSLLLRSEVLYRLSHFRSSLADADSALKNHPPSAQILHRRALALEGLGRNEEALISQCLAVTLDSPASCSTFTSFKNEICRLLQRLLSLDNLAAYSSTPYKGVIWARRRRKDKLTHVIKNVSPNDYDEANSSCEEDDHFIHTRRYSRKMRSHPADYLVPKSSLRLRTLLDRIQLEAAKITRGERITPQLQVNPVKIEVSDFDCVLCCRTLWKPVVTPCGHTYCWVCLDRCMDYSSSCPLCMSPLIEQCRTNSRDSSTPVSFSLDKKSVTKFLEVAMQRFIPEWYEKRHIQEMDTEPSVPVFICTTAFPYVPCPLFVYEPRYRLMVRRAIESGERKFGIVQPHTGKTRYSDIGTMLDIRDCILLGDGCSILSTIGYRRFKILTRAEKDGYETAKVEFIYDEPIPDNYMHIVTQMHTSVLQKATKWFESLAGDIKEEILRSFGPMPPLEDNWEIVPDGPAWAWWIIAILPLNQQLKVNILGTTSLEKRLRAIVKTLDFITGKVRRSQQSCVMMQCEGLPACQSIDCCQRSVTTSSSTTLTQTASNEQSEFLL